MMESDKLKEQLASVENEARALGAGLRMTSKGIPCPHCGELIKAEDLE